MVADSYVPGAEMMTVMGNANERIENTPLQSRERSTKSRHEYSKARLRGPCCIRANAYPNVSVPILAGWPLVTPLPHPDEPAAPQRRHP
jgi:hypothetical protein